MRPLLTITFLLALGAYGAASEQERMINRVLDPNLNKGASEQNRAFSSARAVTTRGATTATFPFQRSFSTSTFQSRSFPAQTFWGGDFQFLQARPYISGRESPAGADRTAATPTVRVSEYRTGREEVAIPYLPEPREGHLRGKSQGFINKYMQPAVQPKLSIDDVRDILNRN